MHTHDSLTDSFAAVSRGNALKFIFAWLGLNFLTKVMPVLVLLALNTLMYLGYLPFWAVVLLVEVDVVLAVAASLVGVIYWVKQSIHATSRRVLQNRPAGTPWPTSRREARRARRRHAA